MYYFLTILMRLLGVAILAFIFTNIVTVISNSKFIIDRRTKKYDFLTEEHIDILKQGIDLEKKTVNNDIYKPVIEKTPSVPKLHNEESAPLVIELLKRSELRKEVSTPLVAELIKKSELNKKIDIPVVVVQFNKLGKNTSSKRILHNSNKYKIDNANLKKLGFNPISEVAITNEEDLFSKTKNNKNSSYD